MAGAYVSYMTISTGAHTMTGQYGVEHLLVKVGPVGIEPTTHRLKVCCSTD